MKLIINQHQKILYLLHFDPEATTCPEGHRWYDQLQFISKLGLFCVNNGYELILREHPDMLKMPVNGFTSGKHIYTNYHSRPRSIEYYKLLIGIKGVSGFANKYKLDSYIDMAKVDAVSTITGTIALESLLKGVPTIIPTGVPNWFNGMPNIVYLDEHLNEEKLTNLKKWLKEQKGINSNFLKEQADKFLIVTRSIYRDMKNYDSLEEFVGLFKQMHEIIVKNENE